ncbi:MAG: hypothetical protein GX034_00830 [Clostridiaceae bacterium]|nr:hypothetical protein [Clostridiaceae bacterium]
MDFYTGLLTGRQRDLLTLYYSDDLSLSEIAEIDGTSRQAVHSVIRRGVERLAEIEASLALVGQYRELNSLLDEIKLKVKNNNYDNLELLLEQLDRSLNRSQEGDS